jgi:hypothetical protein
MAKRIIFLFIVLASYFGSSSWSNDYLNYLHAPVVLLIAVRPPGGVAARCFPVAAFLLVFFNRRPLAVIEEGFAF